LVAALDAERDQLQAELDAVVYPVLSVPAELTTLIFVHSLPSAHFNQPSPLECPLLLTQICRQWRAIAVGTAELWASVAICSARPTSVELFEMWLTRSGVSPLRISLFEPNRMHASRLVNACLQHADRWEDIQLLLPDETLLGLLRDMPRLPLLRKIGMQYSGEGYKDADLESLTLRDAPLLDTAMIERGRGVELKFGLPWNQLSSLK
ncbi:hypothetical protein FB45DRAFT_706893, partial [Roridomyces roridus]